MVPELASSSRGKSPSRDFEKPTSAPVDSTSDSASDLSCSHADRSGSIEPLNGSETTQGRLTSSEAVEIEALAGCGCFPLRTKLTKLSAANPRQQAPKPKKKSRYGYIGDLNDTFYEETDPGRRPYDLPSYGSGGVHQSARASQRHFREWM